MNVEWNGFRRWRSMPKLRRQGKRERNRRTSSEKMQTHRSRMAKPIDEVKALEATTPST